MLKTLTPPRRRGEIHIGPADDGRPMSLADFDRIVNGFKNQMLVMSRYRGSRREKILKPSQKYNTRFLPGFSLDLKRVLSAGK